MAAGLIPTVLDVFTNFVKQRAMQRRLCANHRTKPDAFRAQTLNIAAVAGRQMVGTGRFELPTSRLSVVRSNQLSYAPETLVSKYLLLS